MFKRRFDRHIERRLLSHRCRRGQGCLVLRQRFGLTRFVFTRGPGAVRDHASKHHAAGDR